MTLTSTQPQPQTKISQLRALMAAGDKKRALAFAAKFPQLGQHRDAILRGHQAFTNPSFTKAIKRDPDADIEAGWAALNDAYNKTA